MKKRTIRNAVERVKDELLPQAIRDEAYHRAREEVSRAVAPPRPVLAAEPAPLPVLPAAQVVRAEGTEPTKVKPSETRGNKVFSPDDPRITGIA